MLTPSLLRAGVDKLLVSMQLLTERRAHKDWPVFGVKPFHDTPLGPDIQDLSGLGMRVALTRVAGSSRGLWEPGKGDGRVSGDLFTMQEAKGLSIPPAGDLGGRV